ncbi:MAG: protocatechuate 3,4-dioxygenase, alpha subunit [Cryptosporangiaceae bacterium]|jgi:protocatechuate 3,4-dioxygenase alpha subunit|nr:protocatechuate 3,4-dioxygenase, alpha subunit [Cryptosporangiaceae bacterium]
MTLPLTPSQTVGPYFTLGLSAANQLVPADQPGAIRIGGFVFDGAGEPVPDALVETWQADPDGSFGHPDDPRGLSSSFSGFARCPTGVDGSWSVVTLKPGARPAPGGGTEAPHLDISVFARGLLDRVTTRIYFPAEAANTADPVLSALAPEAAATLVAVPVPGGLRFDIHLQGPDETVFFSV